MQPVSRRKAGRWVISPAWLTVLLAHGVFPPITTLEKLLIVRNTFSIASGVGGLLGAKGLVFLFLVVGRFSLMLRNGPQARAGEFLVAGIGHGHAPSIASVVPSLPIWGRGWHHAGWVGTGPQLG